MNYFMKFPNGCLKRKSLARITSLCSCFIWRSVNALHLEGKSFFAKKDLEGKPETAPKSLK